MATLRPIRGLRPGSDDASRLPSPPYDVLSRDEARALAAGNPVSFLRVIRPEVDLDEGVDLHADEVYEKGAENLRQLVRDGVLQCEPGPCLYLYRLTAGDHVQLGVMGGVDVAEYESGVIKRHELTRPDKEDDRTRHIDTQNAQAGAVLMTYRHRPDLGGLLADLAAARPPDVDFAAEDGVEHALWVISAEDETRRLVAEFTAVPAFYIADGHHRAAAAARVCRSRTAAAAAGATGDAPWGHFLAALFPDDQLRILDYNRIVRDLGAHTPESFLHQLKQTHGVEPVAAGRPRQTGEFGMFLGAQWYRVSVPAAEIPADPVRCLDVALLQERVLAPLLGIEDVRTDPRIDFVGGSRGLTELERRVLATDAVAFAMFPTRVDQLLDVADAGAVMPPKSTWFDPKVRSGMVVHSFEVARSV